MADLLIAVLTLAACVYGTSAGTKLSGRRAYRSYAAGLSEAGLVATRWLPATAAALAGGETVVTAGLAAAAVLTASAAPPAATVTAVSLTAAVLLTAILAAGVAVVLRRGTRARCACFGPGRRQPLGKTHLTRNLSLLAAVAAGLALDVLGPGHPMAAGAVMGAVAGAVVALLLIRLDDLVMVFTPVSRGSAG